MRRSVPRSPGIARRQEAVSIRVEVDGPVNPRLLPSAIRARLAGRTIGAGHPEDQVAAAVARTAAGGGRP